MKAKVKTINNSRDMQIDYSKINEKTMHRFKLLKEIIKNIDITYDIFTQELYDFFMESVERNH